MGREGFRKVLGPRGALSDHSSARELDRGPVIPPQAWGFYLASAAGSPSPRGTQGGCRGLLKSLRRGRAAASVWAELWAPVADAVLEGLERGAPNSCE